MLAFLIAFLICFFERVTCNFLLNSLAPGKFEWNLRYLIFKWISVIDGWGISCEIALIWMSLDCTDDQSTLNQVMAWCCQATSHYLIQCWLRSLSPYGVTRPQWVKYWIKLKHSNEKYCICLWWYWRIFYIKSCDSQHEKHLCILNVGVNHYNTGNFYKTKWLPFYLTCIGH